MAEQGPDVKPPRRTRAGMGSPVKPEAAATAAPADGDAPARRTLSAGADGAPLGIYGKSSAALVTSRREKFALQSAARKLRRGFPVTRCLRWIIPTCHAEIHYAPEHGKAFYGGLETCGSVWECPVCAAKISERRRVEIQTAMALHKAKGGAVLLLTLTNPHYFGDDLDALLAGQKQAMRRFMGGTRASKALFERWGIEGTIRCTDVTFGANGWHPHFHVLLFVKTPVRVTDMLKRDFFGVWLSCCLLAKLPAPSFRHGVDVQDGSFADRYVSKWGLDSELTKGHIKKAKNGGATPFDLLRLYRDGDKQSGARFVEYCNSFKGKRQLVWSKGLKAQFCIEQIEDQELAERQEEDAQLGYRLSREDWSIVRQFDARAEMLEAFENGGAYEVAHCVAILRGDDPGPCPVAVDDLALLMQQMDWTPERFAEFLVFLEDQKCS